MSLRAAVHRIPISMRATSVLAFPCYAGMHSSSSSREESEIGSRLVWPGANRPSPPCRPSWLSFAALCGPGAMRRHGGRCCRLFLMTFSLELAGLLFSCAPDDTGSPHWLINLLIARGADRSAGENIIDGSPRECVCPFVCRWFERMRNIEDVMHLI